MDNVIHDQVVHTATSSTRGEHHTKCDFLGHGISTTRRSSCLIFVTIYILGPTFRNSAEHLKYPQIDYLPRLPKNTHPSTDVPAISFPGTVSSRDRNTQTTQSHHLGDCKLAVIDWRNLRIEWAPCLSMTPMALPSKLAC